MEKHAIRILILTNSSKPIKVSRLQNWRKDVETAMWLCLK